ncbi:MAG: ribose-phosphate pyrophosphokinase [Patescibacteria group bacterium]|nr:ribose-phosphate pyrophosphokinase [Patescibacteria group bacterium]
MKIFSGSSNKPLAEKIALALNLRLSTVDIHIFPDKERRIRILEKVVNEDTVVVQSTSTPADQNYMELFFIIDALKRSGAKSVTAVVPYLGYQRQDHVFRDGEAVSIDVIIKNIESLGVDRIIVFDVHSIKTPELFKIPVFHLSALSVFGDFIKKYYSDSVLVSPDAGGVRRVKILSDMINMPFAVITKDRDLETGEVTAEKIEGLPKNKKVKRAIIVDDMISSGKTIIVAAEMLRKNGVDEVFVFVTHAIFSESAPKLLQKSVVEKVIVTDAVYIPKEKYFPKLKVLSIAKTIADQIKKF